MSRLEMLCCLLWCCRVGCPADANAFYRQWKPAAKLKQWQRVRGEAMPLSLLLLLLLLLLLCTS
jgi:hypothetical protein